MRDFDFTDDDIKEKEIEHAMAQAANTGKERQTTDLKGKTLTTVEVMYLLSLIPDKVPMITALILLLRMTESMHGVVKSAETHDDAERMH